jgi:hypothetical protein
MSLVRISAITLLERELPEIEGLSADSPSGSRDGLSDAD